jgi:molybdopterin/thiamine biosynthesis adenylyltransferase
LLIGAGGLGSPTALYLAAAGVGTIGLMDADVVDVSNLQRQVLHTTADIGNPKVESGARTLTATSTSPGIVGVVQATETVKLLLGIGDPLIGRLLTYDALGMRFREVKLRRDPACPLCGVTPTIKDLSDHPVGDELVCEVPPLR